MCYLDASDLVRNGMQENIRQDSVLCLFLWGNVIVTAMSTLFTK